MKITLIDLLHSARFLYACGLRGRQITEANRGVRVMVDLTAGPPRDAR